MAGTGVKDLRIYQLGKETTPGTPVATTTRWVGGLKIVPKETVLQTVAQTGILVRNPTSDVVAQRHAEVNLMADLSFEQILHVLFMSMKGGVTPATVLTTGKAWTFNPTYLADPALNAFTAQRRLDNGTTQWDERVAFLMARSFKIMGKIGQNAQITAACFGRPTEIAATLTPAIAVPTVNFVPVSIFKLFIDDTAGGIGGTQLSCDVTEFEFDYESMVQPKFYVSGQADKSFCGYGIKRAAWDLKLKVEVDASIIAEQAKAALRSVRYVRLQAIGAVIAGGTANYTITIDLPLRYREGMFDEDGDRDGNDTMTLDLMDSYDTATPIGAKVVVTNSLAALP